MTAATLHRIAASGDVPLLEGRTVTIGSHPPRRIAVFRLLDGWAAIDATCPHRGGPLQDGIVGDACVTCPLHGRRFDLRTGMQLGGEDRVLVHEVVERDGELWLRLAVDGDEADDRAHAASAPAATA
jgi:nitrite reductase (NADH) small subunit